MPELGGQVHARGEPDGGRDHLERPVHEDADPAGDQPRGGGGEVGLGAQQRAQDRHQRPEQQSLEDRQDDVQHGESDEQSRMWVQPVHVADHALSPFCWARHMRA
nr:hypothetical protein GCM10020241_64120 [Streptoalloteichus tenebrarius]